MNFDEDFAADCLVIIVAGIIGVILIFSIYSFIISLFTKGRIKDKYRHVDENKSIYRSSYSPNNNIQKESINNIEKDEVKETVRNTEQEQQNIINDSEKIIEDSIEEPRIPSIIFFPLNNEKFFLKKFDECKFNCVYEAKEVEEGVFHYTIISVGKAKSWDIGDAVVNVGSVLQQDANDFKTVKKGIAVQKNDSGKTYWEIVQPAEIEFKA